MSLKERKYMTPASGDAAVEKKDWLSRINAFGERHSRVIVTLCTALILITVTAFAYTAWKRSASERGQRELAAADTLDALKSLKDRYKGTPIHPMILYRLGNKYYEEGRLDDAKREYLEFKDNYKDDPLEPYLANTYRQLENDIHFRDSVRDQRLKEHLLTVHPEMRAGRAEDPLRLGPVREPDPVVTFETPKGSFSIRIFENDAPNTAANFVKLCADNYFAGLKFPSPTPSRLKIEAKGTGALDYLLPLETTTQKVETGSLVWVKTSDGKNLTGGEFEILLFADESLKEAAVLGVVTEGLENLRKLTKDDAISKSSVASKRDHDYSPQTVQKP
jgi:peptidyl-prolyl cis-trans isomerase B (cyclophilin B)